MREKLVVGRGTVKLIERFLLSRGYMRMPEPGKPRLCRLCGEHINRGHKWLVVRGLPQHWNCHDPLKGNCNQWTKKKIGAIQDTEQTSLTPVE